MTTLYLIPRDDGLLRLSDHRTIDTNELRAGRTYCPFHDGDNKSIFDVDEDKGSFKCWNPKCGRHGKAVEFHVYEELLRKEEDFRNGRASNEVIDKWIEAGDHTKDKKDKKILWDKPVREHIYTDEQGNPVHKKKIFRTEDGKKTAIQYRYENGKWVTKLNGVETLPYNLPNMMKFQRVIYTEGEKDCDTLISMGILNCTTFGSAWEKLESRYEKYFVDKHVIIIPDNDAVGYTCARKLGKALYNIARSVKIYCPSSSPDETGEDITDFLTASNGDGSCLKDKLLSLPEEKREKAFWTILNKLAIIYEAADVLYKFEPQNDDELISFFDFAGKYQTFPLWALPMDLQEYVRTYADHMQVPYDWFAGPILTAASGLLGAKVKAVLGGTWKDVRAHYSFIIVNPRGTKKSHPIKIVMAYIYKLDRDQAEHTRGEIQRYELRKEMARKNKEPFTEAFPGRIHYVMKDATMEQVIQAYEHSTQIIWNEDEFSTIMLSMNQYKGGGGNDLQRFISMHDGVGIKVNRHGKEIIRDNPFLVVLGTIQPQYIPHIFDQLAIDAGYADRINFCFHPRNESELDVEDIDTATDDFLKTTLEYLEGIPLEYVDPTAHIKVVNPLMFDFSPEAKELVKHIINNRIESFRRVCHNDLIQGILAKIETLFVNACLLFHCLHKGKQLAAEPHVYKHRVIGVKSVQRAFALAMYHAWHNYKTLSLTQKTSAMATNDDYEKIVQWCKRKNVTRLTSRDAMMNIYRRKNKKSADDVKALFSALAHSNKGSWDGKYFTLA